MAGIARLDSGLLQDFFGQGATWPMMPGQQGGALRSLLVDVCEKPDAYVMTVDVPGAPTHRIAASPHSERLSRHHARAKPPASSSSVTDEKRARVVWFLAGIPKDNIALDVEGKTIKISTQSTQEEQEKESGTGPEDMQWHRVERSTQFASRALRFPENADMNQARVRGVCAPRVLIGGKRTVGAVRACVRRRVRVQRGIETHAIAFCVRAAMQVQAHVENGVLKVVIGKTAEPQRKRQAVKVT
jgi:HSP20 family molecular chaperone IbpA